MAELWFIGLGLSEDAPLGSSAQKVLAQAGTVFLEEYTSPLTDAARRELERLTGDRLVRADRGTVERADSILEALRTQRFVALVTAGDPFAATTHVALRLRAEEEGHRWRYVPGASVLTAVPSFLGLQHYRFGRTVSIPFPAPGFAPRSFVDHIATNRVAGLHSLVLLDLEPASGRFMTAGEGLELLRARDLPPRALPEETELAVAARIGREDASAWFGSFPALARLEFGPPPHALVVPAPELHFEEAAALARFRTKPPLGRTPAP
ncbi:MAG: diphthine synthase [Thermoplasmata archaeon]|nr:diphthine synthase [Thermoplasmata archaeon]